VAVAARLGKEIINHGTRQPQHCNVVPPDG